MRARPAAVALAASLVSALAAPLLPGVAGAPPAVAATPESAREILDFVDDLFRGRSSHGRLTMSVATTHYRRDLTLETWSQGKDLALIRILAPDKEKGTGTLRSKENIWNYLPRTRQVVKISSSMMGGGWMGSHFTNDDLVKQSRMADDFTFSETFRGPRGGQAVIELTLLPRPDAAVVWGKVVVTVRAQDTMPVQILYYDEDGALARTMSFTDYRTLGNRQLPARLRIVPEGKPGESTEIVYHELHFDPVLPPSLFTLQTLQDTGAR